MIGSENTELNKLKKKLIILLVKNLADCFSVKNQF